MTTYLELTTDALIESISAQANQFADPTIKIQVLELCEQRDKITSFIDIALKYYQSKIGDSQEEQMICLNLLCDLEHNFEDNPITEDENYIPSPLYKYLMSENFRSSNFSQQIDEYELRENLKYNKTLTCSSKAFLKLLEICEKNAYSKLYKENQDTAKNGARDIEKLALIRQEHTENKDSLFCTLLKKIGILHKNSLDMIDEKRYKNITKSSQDNYESH